MTDLSATFIIGFPFSFARDLTNVMTISCMPGQCKAVDIGHTSETSPFYCNVCWPIAFQFLVIISINLCPISVQPLLQPGVTLCLDLFHNQ